MLAIWKYLLRTYYVLNIVLDSWDANMNTDGYWFGIGYSPIERPFL